jgi:pyruvate dehydrogenase E1 component alpha subunit
MISNSTAFEVQRHQALDASGALLDDSGPYASNFDWLKQIYEDIISTRLFDQKCINLQRTGKMGTYPSSLGQEAINAVIGRLMEEEDVFVPYYRDLATQLIRGVPMHKVMLYWGGDERGSHHEKAPHDFPNCVPIATQVTHAAGIATAMKLQRKSHAVVATCGDGATSRGDFYEPLNLAGTWQLPMVMVVNNNQWAISVARGAQTSCQTIAQKAIGAGLEGVQVDGNDPIALAEVISEALNKARQGKGATVIEAITYRLSDHTTADDATRYRSTEEVEKARSEEPSVRLKKYLEANGQWSAADDERLQKCVTDKINTEVEIYLNTPKQPPEEVFDYLYETLPMELIAQREHIQRKAQQQFGEGV